MVQSKLQQCSNPSLAHLTSFNTHTSPEVVIMPIFVDVELGAQKGSHTQVYGHSKYVPVIRTYCH